MNKNIVVDDEPVDVFEKLLEQRILFLTDFITDKVAIEFVQKLLVLGLESDAKISIFLNSDGAQIRALFMIYDAIAIMKCPIEIIATGMCENLSVLLLCAGTKGMRTATPNLLIHLGPVRHEEEVSIPLAELEVENKIFINDDSQFVKLMSTHTGQTEEVIKDLLDKRTVLTVDEAIKLGFIDSKVTK